VNFDVQTFHSVKDVGQEAWDRLGEDRPFASYRWYRFGETVLANDKPIYLLLCIAGEPVARATFWLKRQEALPISSGALRCLFNLLLHRWPLLACGSPLSGSSGLVLPRPPLRDSALETIVQYGKKLLVQYRASFLLFDYLDQQEMEWPGWSDRFVMVPNLHPGTCLAIRWSSFDSYLTQLSKKRRYNLRRNYRLVAEEGIEIKRYRTVRDVDRAMELHRNVNARYHSSTAPWMQKAMAHACMVDSVWLAAERGQDLVGGELMLGDRGSWIVVGLGLDQGIRNVYFVLGYEDIRCAIEHGARALRWGTGTYDVKRRLGFESEDNSNLIFESRWPLLQRLGEWVVDKSLQ
jgi:predicted N-acyltransferase